MGTDEKIQTKVAKSNSLGARLVSERFHERLQFERYPIHDFVRREGIPQMKPGDKVLDAGSGRLPEQYLREEILATRASLTTLDLFAGEGVDVVGDVGKMHFEDGSFDVILCTQVLEHVPNPEEICQELFRVLRPGGVALITAPQSAWLHNMPYHFFHFTRIGLAQILENSGFTISKIEPQGGHFINLAIHLHYTVRVFEDHFSKRSRFARVLSKPLIIFWRVAFGLIFKSVALWVDQKISFEGNTQGWNFSVIKEKQPDPLDL